MVCFVYFVDKRKNLSAKYTKEEKSNDSTALDFALGNMR